MLDSGIAQVRTLFPADISLPNIANLFDLELLAVCKKVSAIRLASTTGDLYEVPTLEQYVSNISKSY